MLPAGDYLVTMRQTPHLSDAYPYSGAVDQGGAGSDECFTAFWVDGGDRIRARPWGLIGSSKRRDLGNRCGIPEARTR